MTHEASPIASAGILPVAYGLEHEVSQLIQIGNGPRRQFEKLATECQVYIPADYTHVNGMFDNGAKLYNGGENNPETATPECRTPKQLVKYQKANLILSGDILEEFLLELSRERPGTRITGWLNDRVMDSYRVGKGSHLSVGFEPSKKHPLDIPTLIAHQATRPFVSGAGWIDPEDNLYHYSQKAGGLVDVSGYGFSGTMYRICTDEGTPRFEDRCGDVNISDWASWQRAGSMALALAISRTPLAKQLPNIAFDEEDPRKSAAIYNICDVDVDGYIHANKASFKALDFQQKMAHLVLSDLARYSDGLPPELAEVAIALYEYCDNFHEVLRGELSIYDFESEADWHLKLQPILSSIRRGRAKGNERTLGDAISRNIDLSYDQRRMVALNGEIIECDEHVLAHQLFKLAGITPMFTEDEVEQALQEPPAGTRAALRSYLMRNYRVQLVDWHYVSILGDEGPGGPTQTIYFNDVLQTRLSRKNRQDLVGIPRKK